MPIRPSVGRVDTTFSGGVFTGVMACNVSLVDFAGRGLGSLPGGEESVLVRGVRACNDAPCPGYAIVISVKEKTEGVELARELSEPIPFSRSPGRCSSSAGESVIVLSCFDIEVLDESAAERGACQLTDQPARRELVRRELLRSPRRESRGLMLVVEVISG